ncbi:MFS transporter [Nocardia sp. FBN12]|uniref:MFS transporter n=1 Tax=Nocardia sp. FBN12 TaxID=3419766 RepID=UPI003CFF086A
MCREQSREIALGTGAMVAVFAFFLMTATHMMSYATAQLGFSRTAVLLAGAAGGLMMAITTVLSAIYSDRFGRRAVVLSGFVLSLAWAPLIFPLIGTGHVGVFTAVLAITFALLGISYGPMAAYLPELFKSHLRYSGAGLAYSA